MTNEYKASSRVLRLRTLAIWTLVASMAACGGGGGSDPAAGPPPAPTPPPAPPPPPAGDVDGDGLDAAAETAAGTSADNPDSDGDGLSDGAEAGLGKNPLVSDNAEAPPSAPVRGVLVAEAGTSPGVILSSDGFSATFDGTLNQDCVNNTGAFTDPVYTEEICRKRAVRANVGVQPGEFRYFETHRTGPAENFGQGIITAGAQIDPYCCFIDSTAPHPLTPPSVTINSSGGVFLRLNFIGGDFGAANFDFAARQATSYYGFAVDYRGTDPVVYLVVRDGAGSMIVSAGITVANFGGGAAMPMLHGHPQVTPRQPLAMNLGLQQFHYNLADVRSALTARGAPNASQFVPGVGAHRWAIAAP